MTEPHANGQQPTGRSTASTAHHANGQTHDKMRTIAGAAEHAANDIEETFPVAADYMRTAAVQINQLLDILRQPNIESIGTIARDTARNQPVLFFAGVAVVGFVAWRILSDLHEDSRSAS